MTKDEKEKLKDLRYKGKDYRAIADTLGISFDTVKSYCRRNGLDYETLKKGELCPVCAEPLINTKGHRQKKYCCEECRRKWWRLHPELKQKLAKSLYEKTCCSCHKSFISYGCKARKYCSWPCYNIGRKEGRNNDQIRELSNGNASSKVNA